MSTILLIINDLYCIYIQEHSKITIFVTIFQISKIRVKLYMGNQGVIQENNLGVGRSQHRKLNASEVSQVWLGRLGGSAVNCSGGVGGGAIFGVKPLAKIVWFSKAYILAENISKFGGFLLTFLLLFSLYSFFQGTGKNF